MSREVVACRPQDSLRDVWHLMQDRDLKQLPVIDHDSMPLGLLYASDALQVLLNEAEFEDLQLRDYVMGVGYR
jgi:predicted transcriptional regulator